jgi:hypothetical protein
MRISITPDEDLLQHDWSIERFALVHYEGTVDAVSVTGDANGR